MDYTITITDTEKKGLEWVAVDPREWIRNEDSGRSQLAIAKILQLNANSIAIAVGEDAQVQQAYDLGVIKTAAQRRAEE